MFNLVVCVNTTSGLHCFDNQFEYPEGAFRLVEELCGGKEGGGWHMNWPLVGSTVSSAVAARVLCGVCMFSVWVSKAAEIHTSRSIELIESELLCLS